MKKKIKIDLNTKYSLPIDINIVHYNGKILVIAPEASNFIVLENEYQLSFLKLLYNHTLGEALSITKTKYDDATYVVTQIEAKKFNSTLARKVEGLFQLHLHLTNACNLRCPHCYMNSGKPDINELNTDEIKKILKKFKEHNGYFLNLSGGEVLMRKDFTEIVKYAKNIGLNITIMSNGTMWTKELVEYISPNITSIQISIDGYDEESNSKIRGFGNFEKSLKTIEYFLSQDVGVRIAITPWLDDELDTKANNYIKFRKELENRFNGKKLDIIFSGEIMSGRNISVSSKDDKYYKSVMKKIIYYDESGISEEDIFIYNQKTKMIKNNWCTYGHLSITANGDVYFCGKVTQCKPVGNIRNFDIDDLMNLSKKARNDSEINNLEPCNKCELRYICGGDCRIIYFDFFKNGKNHLLLPYNKKTTFRRFCNFDKKKYWYDLMISTNDKLYT